MPKSSSRPLPKAPPSCGSTSTAPYAACLRRLRSVVVVRFSEDLAYEEIAHVRGASVNTVKTQLARAKRVMREELKGAWS